MEDEIKRWTAKRKCALVLDIIQGKTTVSEASLIYDLSPSEVEKWVDDAKRGMENALETGSLNIRAADCNQSGHKQSSIKHDPGLIYKSADEIYAKLSSLYDDIGHAFNEIKPYQDMCNAVISLLDGGETADDIFTNHVFSIYLLDKAPGCYISVIVLAYAYCHESIKLLEKGDVAQALISLNNAAVYCEEAGENALSEYRDNTRIDNARAGGIAKYEQIYGSIKKVIAEFLQVNRPPDGWKSQAAAVRAIEDAVNKIQDENFASLNEKLEPKNSLREIKDTLSLDNMNTLLKKWISKDKELRAIFEATRAKPKSK